VLAWLDLQHKVAQTSAKVVDDMRAKVRWERRDRLMELEKRGHRVWVGARDEKVLGEKVKEVLAMSVRPRRDIET
jgi:hypothetical protein